MNELGRLEDLPQDYRDELSAPEPGAAVAQPARRAAARRAAPATPRPHTGLPERCARC
jgi:hypothetical protein